MEFWLRNKLYIFAWILLAAAAALVLASTSGRGAGSSGGSEAEPPRIAISITDDVDFDSGAAVIGNYADDSSVAVSDITMRTQMQGTTNNPDTIWHGDENRTHGGFTIAVPALDGESIGILTIPDIGLSARVYEGEDNMETMEKGVARFRHTSAWEGHIGLSAHNINLNGTPGHFLNIHKLKEGAVIRYETALGVREYAVERVFPVAEHDWSALSRTPENRISLVTCITGSPQLRLVVTAVEIA